MQWKCTTKSIRIPVITISRPWWKLASLFYADRGNRAEKYHLKQVKYFMAETKREEEEDCREQDKDKKTKAWLSADHEKKVNYLGWGTDKKGQKKKRRKTDLPIRKWRVWLWICGLLFKEIANHKYKNQSWLKDQWNTVKSLLHNIHGCSWKDNFTYIPLQAHASFILENFKVIIWVYRHAIIFVCMHGKLYAIYFGQWWEFTW